MRKISVGKNKFALVDDPDYAAVACYKWYLVGKGYAGRNSLDGRHTTIRMHREILGAPPGVFVDHINRNPLDNRRANLRLCTPSQNNMNSVRKNKYKGVRQLPRCDGRYEARITFKGVTASLGTFGSAEAAAKAYDQAAKKHFGEWACLNFP